MSDILWVVEMLCEDSRGCKMWGPTVAVGLTRESARSEQKEMAHNMPDDKFRVTQYIRIQP